MSGLTAPGVSIFPARTHAEQRRSWALLDTCLLKPSAEATASHAARSFVERGVTRFYPPIATWPIRRRPRCRRPQCSSELQPASSLKGRSEPAKAACTESAEEPAPSATSPRGPQVGASTVPLACAALSEGSPKAELLTMGGETSALGMSSGDSDSWQPSTGPEGSTSWQDSSASAVPEEAELRWESGNGQEELPRASRSDPGPTHGAAPRAALQEWGTGPGRKTAEPPGGGSGIGEYYQQRINDANRTSRAPGCTTAQGPTVSAASPRAAEAPEKVAQKEFEWHRNWYAVAVSQDLDPSRPHALSVLGIGVVLWKVRRAEQGEQWKCFLDRCPHRLVPLSEGRIDEGGHLQCSYHGWSFNGTGACVGIPQAHAAGPEANAVMSPRACAVSFPTKEEKGLLFVWPDASAEGRAQAQGTPLPIPEGLSDPKFVMVGTVRDMLYGYEALAENVVDPAHLPFAHHGVFPSHRSQGTPFEEVSLHKGTQGRKGFIGQYMMKGRTPPTVLQFHAPSMVAYLRMGPPANDSTSTEQKSNTAGGTKDAPAGGNGSAGGSEAWGGGRKVQFASVLFITPTEPGRSRLITWEGTDGSTGVPTWLIPRGWMAHLLKLYFLDGDAFFLHAQEKALLAGPPVPEAPSQYFMPTATDKFVAAFKAWWNTYGGGAVPWPRNAATVPPQMLPKEAVLNRYEAHTRHCASCLRAVARLRATRTACFVLAPIVALLALFMPSTVLGIQYAWVGLGISALLALAGATAQRLLPQFFYTGYDHATR